MLVGGARSTYYLLTELIAHFDLVCEIHFQGIEFLGFKMSISGFYFLSSLGLLTLLSFAFFKNNIFSLTLCCVHFLHDLL